MEVETHEKYPVQKPIYMFVSLSLSPFSLIQLYGYYYYCGSHMLLLCLAALIFATMHSVIERRISFSFSSISLSSVIALRQPMPNCYHHHYDQLFSAAFHLAICKYINNLQAMYCCCLNNFFYCFFLFLVVCVHRIIYAFRLFLCFFFISVTDIGSGQIGGSIVCSLRWKRTNINA